MVVMVMLMMVVMVVVIMMAIVMVIASRTRCRRHPGRCTCPAHPWGDHPLENQPFTSIVAIPDLEKSRLEARERDAQFQVHFLAVTAENTQAGIAGLHTHTQISRYVHTRVNGHMNTHTRTYSLSLALPLARVAMQHLSRVHRLGLVLVRAAQSAHGVHDVCGNVRVLAMAGMCRGHRTLLTQQIGNQAHQHKTISLAIQEPPKHTHDIRFTLVSNGGKFGSKNLLATPDTVTNADDQAYEPLDLKHKVKLSSLSEARGVVNLKPPRGCPIPSMHTRRDALHDLEANVLALPVTIEPQHLPIASNTA